jgi:hypothetical protein
MQMYIPSCASVSLIHQVKVHVANHECHMCSLERFSLRLLSPNDAKGNGEPTKNLRLGPELHRGDETVEAPFVHDRLHDVHLPLTLSFRTHWQTHVSAHEATCFTKCSCAHKCCSRQIACTQPLRVVVRWRTAHPQRAQLSMLLRPRPHVPLVRRDVLLRKITKNAR